MLYNPTATSKKRALIGGNNLLTCPSFCITVRATILHQGGMTLQNLNPVEKELDSSGPTHQTLLLAVGRGYGYQHHTPKLE
jgi:hypothetical protein